MWRGSLEWSPEQPAAQGVHSSALPLGPAGYTQARVRTNHNQAFGTGPFLRALSQNLKPGKGKICFI